MSPTRTKYPRTYHVPWSPGTTSDDRLLSTQDVEGMFSGKQVVVTTKLDGENTTIYTDGTCHARSMDSRSHPTRSWVQQLAARIGHDIPEGWRVCGENMYAKHSIFYPNLTTYFYAFAIFDEQNRSLSWADLTSYAELLGLEMVPVLYRGMYDEDTIKGCLSTPTGLGEQDEGYVVRLEDAFPFEMFARSVAKWVRKGHVQTGEHWMSGPIVPNRFRED